MEGFSAHSPARGAAKPKQLVLTPGLTLGVGAEIGPMIEPNETTSSCHFLDSSFMLHIDHDYDYNIHIISNLVI